MPAPALTAAPTTYCPEQPPGAVWSRAYGVRIPTTTDCDWRGDIQGRAFAMWCDVAGMPVGVPIPSEVADLISAAYRAQRRDGGHFLTGQCGLLLLDAKMALTTAATAFEAREIADEMERAA